MEKNQKTIFEINSNQAMDWLFRNRNALVVMANIIGKSGISRSLHSLTKKIELEEDECFFRINNIKTKPELTYSQIRTSLNNLEHYGFIKIIKIEDACVFSGIKKIKILVNPFDRQIGAKVWEEFQGGFPRFD